MPGPLMTSMIAMFGERSLLALANDSNDTISAVSQICQSGRMPFATFTDYEIYAAECAKPNKDSREQADDAVSSITRDFFAFMFNETYFVERRLSAGM